MEYLSIIFGAALVGLSYNIFLLPARLAAGGVSGISTILYELYQYNPAYVQLLINIPVFIAGFLLLGKEFSLKTLAGTFFVPFTIWISADIPFSTDNPLLAAIYGEASWELALELFTGEMDRPGAGDRGANREEIYRPVQRLLAINS